MIDSLKANTESVCRALQFRHLGWELPERGGGRRREGKREERTTEQSAERREEGGKLVGIFLGDFFLTQVIFRGSPHLIPCPPFYYPFSSGSLKCLFAVQAQRQLSLQRLCHDVPLGE